jgi:ribonuclease HI
MTDVHPKRVVIYTDGACSGNPGPGGWAAVLRYNQHEKVLTGAEPNTTNNRMELTAVIEALRALKTPCTVELYTDSNYLVRAVEEGWLERWQQKGWRTASRKPVENQDLWRELWDLIRRHQVRFIKVKGHAGDALNNRVDRLAVEAMRKLKAAMTA